MTCPIPIRPTRTAPTAAPVATCLIANTGGDRLIDWVGEFNSYLVPFAPFGMGTVSRTLQPQLADYLYALSAADGADPSRDEDTGADPARNGEPEGELGVVRQQDFAWKDQTGAPDRSAGRATSRAARAMCCARPISTTPARPAASSPTAACGRSPAASCR